MSGRATNKISRKNFLLQCSALALIPIACSKRKLYLPGAILGANSSKGHKLRQQVVQKPISTLEKPIVIVGGGIAGLSAAYELKRNGIEHFVLLEQADEVGGNAASGENNTGKYPWGAHYLPVPDHRDKDLLNFLEEIGVITGYNDDGLPLYQEEYLCFTPEERLYINGYWQEGLIPRFGVSKAEAAQIKRFFDEIENYRTATGQDGKDAFCIPVQYSSDDANFRKLDEITFATYLQQHGFTSPYLLWYLNYCTKDDYGGTIDVVSAWAAIHYFAARKGKAGNTHYDTVLTWPEGNAWLVEQLRKQVATHIITDALVFKIAPGLTKREKTSVQYLSGNTCREFMANEVIVATPQFINSRIVNGYTAIFPDTKLDYTPWMVANITVESFYENNKGIGMCWDNVIYGSTSLGYVNAAHQHLAQHASHKVLTFYYPLCDSPAPEQRKLAMNRSHEDWVKLILQELKLVHPGIESMIKNIDVWLWGHGMVLPIPGLQKQRAARLVKHSKTFSLHFAHSDLSGVSIFEEAFHQGLNAARQVILSQHDQA